MIDASPSPSFDVVIIGRGPVGATLANLLGLCGLRTLVLEREAASYHLPRAVHFDDEVMRVFQTIGLSDAILPLVMLSPGMQFVDAERRLILDWSRPSQLTPMGWNLSYRFHQPELEQVLNDGLARWPQVEVRNRCDVFALHQNNAGVCIRYEDLASGKLMSVQARYAVGCDGARSLTRRVIGSENLDLGFHERWLVVDVMLKRDCPDLGDHSIQYCDARRPATYVRGTGARRRWEITVHPHEDAPTLTQPDAVWRLLAPWINEDDATIERAAVYTFHSTIAKQWRDRRLLLAGDSAHQTPPFLGQGMCAGIRDAANLAWKLDAVLRGRASPDLLDSYQSERMPHVREFIELAIRLGGLINTTATEIGLATGETRPGTPALLKVEKPRLGCALSAADDALSGRISPQFTMAGGGRSDDSVGYAFSLLAEPGIVARCSPSDLSRLSKLGVAIVTSSAVDGLDAWLAEQCVCAALIRPDRYVLRTARTHHDVSELLDAVDNLKLLRNASHLFSPTRAEP